MVPFSRYLNIDLLYVTVLSLFFHTTPENFQRMSTVFFFHFKFHCFSNLVFLEITTILLITFASCGADGVLKQGRPPEKQNKL